MTTEDDFQAALDADPENWQTRLVFADWLQERGDPRAEGYRALGVLRRRPFRWGTRTPTRRGWSYHSGEGSSDASDHRANGIQRRGRRAGNGNAVPADGRGIRRRALLLP